MAFRSTVARFHRSLAVGATALALVWAGLEGSALPRTAFFGGRRLAEKWVRLGALERAGPIDVFVVGASQVDQGVDARRFDEVSGERAFNFGISGTDTYFQSLLVRELLLTGRKPRAVVWALLDSTQRRSNINRQYLAAPAASLASGPAGRLGFELGSRLPQFQRRRLHEWIEELRGDLPEPVDEFGRVLLPTARRPTRAEMLAAFEDEGEAPATSAPALDDEEGGYGLDLLQVRAHVAETLRELRAAGVRVWLLFTPFSAENFERRSVHAWRMLTRTHEGHLEWVAELARELDIEVLDLHFCAGISDDPALFYDSTHLNGAGSARFGELLGELHAGKRALPDAWRGVPSSAHLFAILGHEPPAAPARLELGARVRLAEHAEFFPTGTRADLYATVAIDEPGRYRLELSDDAPRERSAGCYVRVGPGPHRFWRAPERRRDAVWTLARGEQRIELHAATGTIDWDELALVRE